MDIFFNDLFTYIVKQLDKKRESCVIPARYVV